MPTVAAEAIGGHIGTYWNVGTITDSGRPGVVTLDVFRVADDAAGWRPLRAVHREFASSAEADAYALSHGYTRPYVRGEWCRKCRSQHWWMGHRTNPGPTDGPCADYARDGELGRASDCPHCGHTMLAHRYQAGAYRSDCKARDCDCSIAH